MKTLKPIAGVLLLTTFLATHNLVKAQNSCVNPVTQIANSWSGVPLFDGNDSRIVIHDAPHSTAWDWFRGHFTIDAWVKPRWNVNGDEYYTLMSAGNWDDDHNAFIVYFQKTGGTYRIRVSDGNDSGGNDDFYWNTNYANNWKDKWVHIILTYDDWTIRLYVNGIFRHQQSGFIFNDIPNNFFYIGRESLTSNTDFGFHGDVSNFRLWRNRALTQAEIDYTWNRTFQSRETFRDDIAYLYDRLFLNLYPAKGTGQESFPHAGYIGGRAPVVFEDGVTLEPGSFHPAHPIKPFGLTATSQCQSIDLNWSLGHRAGTSVIYRKKESDPGEGVVICFTDQTSYTDDDPELEPGINYVYTIKTLWRTSNGLRGTLPLDEVKVTAALKR